jgi:hypothetical protein
MVFNGCKKYALAIFDADKRESKELKLPEEKMIRKISVSQEPTRKLLTTKSKSYIIL